jgi:hypothetical protein
MNEDHPPRKKRLGLLKRTRSNPHLAEERGRKAVIDVWILPLQLCVVSNYDYSRPLSHLRGMDLAVDYRGCFPSACASASLEALNSLPTLDPQLQVLAHGISYTLKQPRYVQLLVRSVCDLTTNGRRIFHYSLLPLPSQILTSPPNRAPQTRARLTQFVFLSSLF